MSNSKGFNECIRRGDAWVARAVGVLTVAAYQLAEDFWTLCQDASELSAVRKHYELRRKTLVHRIKNPEIRCEWQRMGTLVRYAGQLATIARDVERLGKEYPSFDKKWVTQPSKKAGNSKPKKGLTYLNQRTAKVAELAKFWALCEAQLRKCRSNAQVVQWVQQSTARLLMEIERGSKPYERARTLAEAAKRDAMRDMGVANS